MNDILKRIKRLLLSGRYFFTDKATVERERDGLSEEDIVEAIINAQSIQKVINSQSPHRREKREKRYVILSFTFDGVLVYTKGKIVHEPDGSDKFYVLVSSKKSVLN